MINTSKHIEDAIKFLNNQDVENLNLQFIYQTDYFNSEDYNTTLTNVESHLNVLYEKARVLQDVITYTREYVKQNIYDVTDECKAILESIEDNVDSLKQNNYININVSFLESTGSYTDRDTKILPKHAIYDSTITLSGKDKEKIKIKSIKQMNNFKPYNSNITNLIEEKEYRSFYMLDEPITNGLKDIVHIDFESESIINQLNIIASNCKISDVKYMDGNGTTDYVQEHINVIQHSRKTKALEFMATTEFYKKITYYIDQARLKSNFWDSIMAHEYTKMTTGTGTLTQGQIDEMAGISAFKKDYDAYVKEVENWIAKRTAVVAQNKSNGYSDAVPEIDFIVKPSSISGILNTEETTTSGSAVTYNYNKNSIVQSELRITDVPNVFPDSEKYKHQNYNEAGNSLVDKTGNDVNYFLTLNEPKAYAKSYQRK